MITHQLATVREVIRLAGWYSVFKAGLHLLNRYS